MVRGRLVVAGTLLALATACSPTAPASAPTPAVSGPSVTAASPVPTGPATSATPAAPSPGGPSPSPTATPTPTPARVTVAVVGDSLTSGPEAEIYSVGDYPDDSWLTYLSDSVEVVDVWAVPGTTTEDMLLGATGTTSAELLVLMAGENDSDSGRPWMDSVDDILGLVDIMQPRRVLLVGPTPTDYDIATCIYLNNALAELARINGWGFVDASTGVRTDEGAWRDGMSDDGTHPNATSAPIIAKTIEEAILG